MVFRVVGQCLIARWPRPHTPPHVNLRARRHPPKVRVNVRADGRTPILPREVVNASRALGEAPGEARERRPVRVRRRGHAAAALLGREPQ
eukprot:1592331-Alexandrium_andersonii.AAC.1